MRFICFEDGAENMLPWVSVELTPGRWPFEWWYEVSYWDEEDKCWVHDWEKDGGAFGFTRAAKKAQEVLSKVWEEQWDELKKK